MKTIIIFIFSFILLNSAYAERPNIIIISIDSFRREPSFPKNFDSKQMPNLDRFTNDGILYKNVFSANSWANLGQWIAKIPNKIFQKSGYQFPGLGWNIPTMRKFSIDKNDDFPPHFFILLPAEKNKFEKGLNHVNQQIARGSNKPFFLQIHLKNLHPPLFRTLPKNEELKSMLIAYKTNPENYPDKAVLFSILFDDELRTRHSPQVLKAVLTLTQQNKISRDYLKLKYVNLTEIPVMIDLWKKSKNYAKDLLLIRELYNLNLIELDHRFGELLANFEKQNKLKNSIVFICGNFGFGMMEHDSIFNSVANYDEFIGTHLFIKIPEDRGLKVIEQQASLMSVGTFIYTLLDKGYQADNLNFIVEPELISKNYNKDKFSLRQNNEWKMHLDLVNSSRELYDLKQDPGEKNNVILSYPEKAGELESKILNHVISEMKDEI